MPDVAPFNVLFLCTHNSARSIMAEAILNRIGVGAFKAYSAGSAPRGEPNPHAIALLKSLDHDTAFAASKSWDAFSGPDAPAMDFVFTVCDDAAGETCPVWPGQPMTAHWGIPDPSAVTGENWEVAQAFRDAYRMLERRIGVFTSLPLRTLDQMTLRRELQGIGALQRASSGAKAATDIAGS